MTTIIADDALALQRLYHWERTAPERVALTQPLGGGVVRDYTWREVLDQSRRMAAHLQSLGDDDFTNTAGMSGFTSVLTAGTSYFFITTGFGNSDDGAFSNSIIGPGRVILPGPIFVDGFETGNFTWSSTQP